MTTITLLGPQRVAPTVASVLGSLGLEGPYAVITAGWQEREGEVDELAGHVHGEVTDLALYRRGEEVFHADPELFRAHRERQEQLKEQQRLYRIRLGYTIEAAREVMRARGDKRLLERERRAAITALRALDRHHLKRINTAHEAFDQGFAPQSRPALSDVRAELAQIIGRSRAVLIAGGHVAVLLNRMRLFDLGPLLANVPIVAWSAGAMVLSERVVLFHDSPPQGPGDAEVLDAGLGRLTGVVPLPHAARRLDLKDRLRISLFARRFAPAACITLDPGTVVHRSGGRVREVRDAFRLTPRGRLGRVIAA